MSPELRRNWRDITTSLEPAFSVRGEARLLLASRSPRRRRLIGLLGLPFEAVVTEVDEAARPHERPAETAMRLARAKAEAVAPQAQRGLVLAADTVVALEGESLGQPADPEQARVMLRRLRGRSHDVLTAVALLDAERGAWHEAAVRTEVRMRAYGEAEVEAYAASGAPMDKAGAYGIQDLPFEPVERIEGCYLNVVGLPLCEVLRGLAALGHVPPGLAPEPLAPPCRLCHEGARILGVRIG